MIQKLSRILRIFKLQSKTLPFSKLVLFCLGWLFKLESILIFVKDLNDEIVFKNGSNDSMHIKKGELNELQNIRKGMKLPPWRFCLDMYDKVSDFFIYKDNDGMIGHISWIYYKGNHKSLLQKQRRLTEQYYMVGHSSRLCTIYSACGVLSCVSARGS